MDTSSQHSEEDEVIEEVRAEVIRLAKEFGVDANELWEKPWLVSEVIRVTKRKRRMRV